MILFVQTFGDLANFHPHVHVLAADGAFLPDGGFVPLPAVSEALLAEGFRRAEGPMRVIALIDDPPVVRRFLETDRKKRLVEAAGIDVRPSCDLLERIWTGRPKMIPPSIPQSTRPTLGVTRIALSPRRTTPSHPEQDRETDLRR